MNYKVIERKDPRNPEAPGKYYGFIVNLSKIGIEEIATRISGTCTVTRHDCLAVLSALQEQIIYALQEGKRVHLGDIGSFRTVANGLGSDTAENTTRPTSPNSASASRPTPSSKKPCRSTTRLSRSNGWTSCLKRRTARKKATSNSGRKWKS